MHLEWHKEWFKKMPRSLKMYAKIPQELRIDPSYCPCERRFSWIEYEKLRETKPYMLNFPKIQGPSIDKDLNGVISKAYISAYLEQVKVEKIRYP